MQKAFKFRIYPTEEQKAELARQFGHARFVYNAALDLRKRMFFDHDTNFNYYDCADVLVQVKETEDFEWLSQADSQVLQQALKDLDNAFSRYFDMCNGKLPKPKPGKKPRKDGMELGYPTFKRKFDKQSIRYPQRFKLEGQRIYLPKVGWVKIVRHRRIEGEMRNVTVSKTKTGQYFAAIQCAIETDIQPTSNQQEAVGIDLGLKDFAILSTGEKVEPPQHLRVVERRLKIRQRRLSRKDKGSNGQKKARLVVASTHEKITNRRKDFHHQLSRRIVDQFGVIGLETLNVKGMMQNGNLAKSIADAGWSQFVSFVEYKAAWAGAEVVRHDPWFASSKTCNDCGFINRALKQSDRTWVCPSCGVIHDRDENAANNLVPSSTAGAAGINAGWNGRKTDMSSAVRHSVPEKSQDYAQLTLFWS